MKILLKIWLTILLVAALCRCTSRKDEQGRETMVATIEIGKHSGITDSLRYELNLDSFNTYKDLVFKTGKSVCNDSFPTLIIRDNNEIKAIHLSNPCWDGYACILIFQRNTFQIHNDSIIKGFFKFPIDSLYPLLKRDLENNGKEFHYSENPEKLLIFISLDSGNLKKLPSILDKTTDAYRKITDRTDLRILLNIWSGSIPPPPPPEQVSINAL